MSFRSSNTKPVVTKPVVTKPTIVPPHTLSDCRIILKRIDDDDTRQKEDLKDIQSKISILNTRLAEIQAEINSLDRDQSAIKSQISQNDINKEFLSDCLIKLESIDMANTYVKRCIALIATYKWKKDDGDDDEDDDEKKYDVDDDEDDKKDDNTLKTLPYNIFDFLKLKFAPLKSFTSDEIIKIAHYLKACELVNDEKIAYLKACERVDYDDDETDYQIPDYCDTYADIINYAVKYNGKYVIGEITGCSCRQRDCDDKYKRYGYVVTPLKNIDLDSRKIICWKSLH
jgi:hypothetical protein